MAPKISIVVNLFNMRREAARTLYSLSPCYQIGGNIHDYEVLVVENGSSSPLSSTALASLPDNFEYIYHEDDTASPVTAINLAVSRANGDYIGIMVDGARLCSPGILKYANAAIQAFDQPTVSTLAWHIGSELQQDSVPRGYGQEQEDKLFEYIDWPTDGYRMFEISTLAMSSQSGWFGPLVESNCLFVPRERFNDLGGLNPKFRSPGGGFANLDFYKRATQDCCTVVLLGEGTFHQIHADAVTTSGFDESLMQSMIEEYESIVGSPFQPNLIAPEFIGHLPPSAERAFATSLAYLYPPVASPFTTRSNLSSPRSDSITV